jgi:hypothetical protein
MRQPPTGQTTQEPLDDDERELMDPENWDWDNPIEVRVVGTLGAVVRVHFSRDEFFAVARLAREAGLAPVAFIQRTMLDLVAAEQEAERGKDQKRPA